jgi:hypothetical protein
MTSTLRRFASRWPHRLALISAAALSASCVELLFGTGYYERPDLDSTNVYDAVNQITVPDTVVAGTNFVARIVTPGGGCVRKIGPDVVTRSSTLVSIELLNRHSGADVCTSDLQIIPHEHTVVFNSPGERVVRFIGATERVRVGRTYTEVVIDRTVVVLPAP